MRDFAALYDEIDASTSTLAKTAALRRYFEGAPPDDAAWAVSFLLGRRRKRLVRTADLRELAATAASIPQWLFEESYSQVGDLAETISLLLPDVSTDVSGTLTSWVNSTILPLGAMEPDAQRERLLAAWEQLGGTARFVFNKLLTGAFRVGVSDGLVVRALSESSGVPSDVIAHRLMGKWEPSAEWFTQLVSTETDDADWSRPYPFCLAHALTDPLETLGDISSWSAEWKWDGIRAQLIKRRGRIALWSRGEELLTGRFPEVETIASLLPDGTVLDGELLGWLHDAPLPFSALQRRINRKTVGKLLLTQVPVRLLAYDCLEHTGLDTRSLSFEKRRALLEQVVHALPPSAPIHLSPLLDVESWTAVSEARARAREMRAEGLMLKRVVSTYAAGRKTGDWWKWKVEPFTLDAVLINAQAGHGRRSGLFTDYTFAVWKDNELVPIAKAYSGLTDAEIREVDRFVRANTLEKFGPVRAVAPQLVFELAFEGIQESSRHKSGLAVRFPRIARWRRDKQASDADSVDRVRELLRIHVGDR